jgi:hypothetical protein
MHGTWASAVLLVCVGLGCDSAPASSPRFGALGRGGDAAPPAPAVQQPTLFTAEGGPVVPGEPPSGISGTAPSDCAGCHAEIAAEWASSAHARSWTDPIFQSEYQLTRQAFCRHCHAPLALEAELDTVPAASRARPGCLPSTAICCDELMMSLVGEHEARPGRRRRAPRRRRSASSRSSPGLASWRRPHGGDRRARGPGRPGGRPASSAAGRRRRPGRHGGRARGSQGDVAGGERHGLPRDPRRPGVPGATAREFR